MSANMIKRFFVAAVLIHLPWRKKIRGITIHRAERRTDAGGAGLRINFGGIVQHCGTDAFVNKIVCAVGWRSGHRAVRIGLLVLLQMIPADKYDPANAPLGA